MPISRRDFLNKNALGMGAVALAVLLDEQELLGKPASVPKVQPVFDLAPRQPHLPPRARAMISLFQHGGPSHMDLTDPKPELNRRDGQEYSGDMQYSFANAASKKLLGSRWRFALVARAERNSPSCCRTRRHCGRHLPDSQHAHRSERARSFDSLFSRGIPGVLGRPHFASWLLYGLGSETSDLPAYMVLPTPVDLRWKRSITGRTDLCRRCFRAPCSGRTNRGF